MAKFHVNTKTGDIGPCRATQGKCPFGGADGKENHYDSIVDAAKAYEKSMNMETFKQDWHWNKRTNSPAWCPNPGCPIGASNSEHYASEQEAKQAQSARWHELKDANMLKGKELTAVAKFAQDPELTKYALEKGTVNQVGAVLHRLSGEFYWKQRDNEVLSPEKDLVDAYKIAAERKVHVKSLRDFIYSSPKVPTKWAFLSKNNILNDREINEIFLDYPPFFFQQSGDEAIALAENDRLLKLLEDHANNGILAPEKAKSLHSTLSSTDNGSYPNFRKKEHNQEPGPLWPQFKKTQEALWNASY